MKNKSYFGDRYTRVKLYKKGKFWVASSLTLLSLGIGVGGQALLTHKKCLKLQLNQHKFLVNDLLAKAARRLFKHNQVHN
ncbi:KxYKxGKxW signal peptide domain-containing protein [Ligilactobacillus aviarius]|uniref:KxYKxGKxW signal peptide domain-containing protein n=1 Tax=Ligilactobacillus aviarius TaxID=1606 RepID=UPI00336521AB